MSISVLSEMDRFFLPERKHHTHLLEHLHCTLLLSFEKKTLDRRTDRLDGWIGRMDGWIGGIYGWANWDDRMDG